MITFFGYVALGVIADILVARYYMALSAHRALRASVLAAAIPLTTFLVMERALATRNVSLFLAFTAGNAMGTYWVVKHDKSF